MEFRTMEPTTYLSPPAAAEYLRTRHGIRTSVSSLAKWRCYGVGPNFYKPTANAVIYSVHDLDEWAEARRGPRLASTRSPLGAPSCS